MIFGANFITEYMLYSFLFPFPLLPVYYIPGHLLMQKMEGSVNVLAKNQEKFWTITIGKFQIRDSLEHVPSSLEVLMSDLCKDKTFTFPLLKQFDPYKKLSARQKMKGLKLLKRKGVYRYEYFSSYESLKNSQFLSIAAFY